MADARQTGSISDHAAAMVGADGVVGLGTGRAATAFIHTLGARVRAGLRVRGVPTSQASADLARQLGIPLATFDEVERIDLTVDGADEVDPAGDLIKGYGGALVREKVVAAFSRRFVVLVGAEKLVAALGSRGVLPVEVVPFALTPCRRHLEALGFPGTLREKDGKTFVTDNGNHVLDCKVPALPDPAGTERALLAIPGVVGTGLFLKMAHTILIQHDDGVETRHGAA